MVKLRPPTGYRLPPTAYRVADRLVGVLACLRAVRALLEVVLAVLRPPVRPMRRRTALTHLERAWPCTVR